MLWCLVLFVLGISLVVLEFFLPGAVCGIVGIALLVISTGFGINAYPEYTFFIIIGETLGALFGVALGLYLLANTDLGKGLFLNTTLAPDGGGVSAGISTGAIGVVLTDLRPSGTIEVGGERFDVVSDGDLIEEGAHVQVIEVHGNRIVVEEAPSVEVVGETNQDGDGT